MTVVDGSFEYRGTLNWHQLVSKMLRKGFEQDPDFDKLCQSNSYESKEEVKDDGYKYSGPIRPFPYTFTGRRKIPDNIKKPDYAGSGQPNMQK